MSWSADGRYVGDGMNAEGYACTVDSSQVHFLSTDPGRLMLNPMSAVERELNPEFHQRWSAAWRMPS